MSACAQHGSFCAQRRPLVITRKNAIDSCYGHDWRLTSLSSEDLIAWIEDCRREAAFQNLALYHRSSPGCHRETFARLFEAAQFFCAAYIFFEIFSESIP